MIICLFSLLGKNVEVCTMPLLVWIERVKTWTLITLQNLVDVIWPSPRCLYHCASRAIFKQCPAIWDLYGDFVTAYGVAVRIAVGIHISLFCCQNSIITIDFDYFFVHIIILSKRVQPKFSSQGCEYNLPWHMPTLLP